MSVQQQCQKFMFTSGHCRIKESESFFSDRDKHNPLLLMTGCLKYSYSSQFCHWIVLNDESSSIHLRTEARLTRQVLEYEKAC